MMPVLLRTVPLGGSATSSLEFAVPFSNHSMTATGRALLFLLLLLVSFGKHFHNSALPGILFFLNIQELFKKPPQHSGYHRSSQSILLVISDPCNN